MATNWKPLLAGLLPIGHDLSKLPYPLWASPKIDGFRCTIQGGNPLTRKGLVFRNTMVQKLYSERAFEGLDTELIVGKPWDPDVFNRTQRVVNNSSAEAAAEFERDGCMMVIDKYSEYGDFETRQRVLYETGALVSGYTLGYTEIIKQTLIRTEKQLLAYEEKCLKRGYEGVMLRRAMSGVHGDDLALGQPGYPQKPGKENRSTLNEFWLVKLKRFDYGECRILEPFYLEHNTNKEVTAAGKRSTKKAGIVVDKTQIGKVLVRDTGQYGEFRLTVPTNLLRSKGMDWWKKQRGKLIRYKFQLVGTLNAPRIVTATFKELL